MPVPSAISDLSTTAADNSPAGSEAVLPNLDNYLRAHASFIATVAADLDTAEASISARQTGTGPVFSAYPAVAQSIPNATATKVTLGTEEFDTASNFASSRFTPTTAGYYQISGAVGFGTPCQMYASIYKNGAEYKRGTQPTTGSGDTSGVSALVYCNGSTDYVELYAFQSSGGAQNALATAHLTYFQGALVRQA